MDKGRNIDYIEEEPSMIDEYQNQMNEEEEKEHRMLDMINKVQMI